MACRISSRASASDRGNGILPCASGFTTFAGQYFCSTAASTALDSAGAWSATAIAGQQQIAGLAQILRRWSAGDGFLQPRRERPVLRPRTAIPGTSRYTMANWRRSLFLGSSAHAMARRPTLFIAAALIEKCRGETPAPAMERCPAISV